MGQTNESSGSPSTDWLICPHRLCWPAVIGLVGRCRRLVRAVLHAVDAGDALEAQLFVRALVEHAITIPWMALDPDLHIKQWLIEDIRQTLVMDGETRQLEGEAILADENRQRYEELSESLRQACGERPTTLPNLQTHADRIGLH